MGVREGGRFREGESQTPTLPPPPLLQEEPALLPSWGTSSLGSGAQPHWCFRTYSWKDQVGWELALQATFGCQRDHRLPTFCEVGSGIYIFPGWQTEAQDKGNTYLASPSQQVAEEPEFKESPAGYAIDLARRLIHSYPEKAQVTPGRDKETHLERQPGKDLGGGRRGACGPDSPALLSSPSVSHPIHFFIWREKTP